MSALAISVRGPTRSHGPLSAVDGVNLQFSRASCTRWWGNGVEETTLVQRGGSVQGDRSMRRTVESPRTSATRTSSAPVAPGTQLVMTTGMDREMPQSTTRRRAVISPRAHSRDDRLPLIDKVASRRGYPDGAWAPRSTSLPSELPALVADLKEQGFVVDQVLYNPALWDEAPSGMRTSGQPVELGASSALSSHLIRLLLGNTYRCIDLLILFPGPRRCSGAGTGVTEQESPGRARPVTVHTYEPVAALSV